MKKLLLPFLCMLCLNVHAQLLSINSVQVIPSNPTSIDTLYLIVSCTFSSGDCSMLSSNIQVSSGGILVNGNYCPGMLTFICTSVDTVKIGTVPSGTYVINFSANTGTSPGCNQFSPAGNSTISINVTGATGINDDLFLETNFVIEQTSGYGNFIFKSSGLSAPAILEIYNADGKVVFQKQVTRTMEELKLRFPSGIYFYKVESEGKSSSSKKLVIL